MWGTSKCGDTVRLMGVGRLASFPGLPRYGETSGCASEYGGEENSWCRETTE